MLNLFLVQFRKSRELCIINAIFSLVNSRNVLNKNKICMLIYIVIPVDMASTFRFKLCSNFYTLLGIASGGFVFRFGKNLMHLKLKCRL